jgi:phenylalanyl-tRNA synthetase alpha chain
MVDQLKVSKTSKFSILTFKSESDSLTVSSIDGPQVSKVAPAPNSIPSLSQSQTSISAPPNAVIDLEQHILSLLAAQGEIGDSYFLAQELEHDHQMLIGVVKSLLVDQYVEGESLSTTYWTVTDEGREVANRGSPELQVLAAVLKASAQGGITVGELNSSLEEVAKIGLGVCMKSKWVGKQGDKIVALVTALPSDATAEMLRKVDKLGDEELKALKKRKLVVQLTRKSYRLTKGANFREIRVRKAADLHRSMLTATAADGNSSSGDSSLHWSTLSFKAVNLQAMGAGLHGGCFHPLLKVRTEFRRILMDMGFEEMPSNKWVESSFWNFDALFQPQSHPARDAHDTFFIKEPARTASIPQEYYERVRQIHEQGGYESIGYQYRFKEEEARKNLLRTHTTAISAQMLFQLAQEPVFAPRKYFSIDRVFRNEAMDATHLCEFHQVEGLVADRGLTLGHLIGLIKAFFHQIGITQLRFKPAYNPYTEPSMEIFGYHPDLKKWTEIGNSGMFRPEMLRPMGLPEDVRVIAWGLSLERPTMIKYRMENIRDLFGHKADLSKQRHAPIARF